MGLCKIDFVVGTKGKMAAKEERRKCNFWCCCCWRYCNAKVTTCTSISPTFSDKWVSFLAKRFDDHVYGVIYVRLL